VPSRQLDLAEALHHLEALSLDLSRASTVEEVGRALLEAGRSAIGAETGILWAIDGPSAGVVAQVPASAELPPSDRAHRAGVALDPASPFAESVSRREPVFVERPSTPADRAPAASSHGVPLDAHAFACLPLVAEGQVLALAGLAFTGDHTFESGERQFLTSAARSATIAWQRACDRTKRESTSRQLRRLCEVTDAIAEAQTPRDVADATVRLGTAAVDAWAGAIWLAQPDGSLQLETAHNVPERYLDDWREIAGEAASLVARVFRTGLPIWVEDPDDFAREAPDLVACARAMNRLWPFVALPLCARSGPIGVLSFSYGPRTRHMFSDDEKQLLLALVRGCEHALERIQSSLAQEQARREAEAASDGKDKLLAMLGHELRNPLAAMVSAMELVKVRDPKLGREMAVLDRHLGHLVHLVGALLDVSRISHGKIVLDRTAVEVATALSHALETARPLLDGAQHRVSTSVPGDLLVDADRERLSQVLANLIINAAKYTPPEGEIEIIADRDDGYARIAVRDNGAGIEPELLPYVFDMFVQGERRIDRRDGGLGLGLTIVRMLVELHGGTVHGESDGPGKGATFVLRWPRATSATATARMSALAGPDID
jgi:signal transduction histidine kinase